MKLFFTSCTLLAVALAVNAAVISNTYSSSGGGSYIQASSYPGATTVKGGSISVSQVNGNTEIYLDGKRIDLKIAQVLHEDHRIIVLSPVEVDGATVTLDKTNGQLTVEYNGARYQSLTPEMIEAQVSQANAQLQQQLNDLQSSLGQIFSSGFPFSG